MKKKIYVMSIAFVALFSFIFQGWFGYKNNSNNGSISGLPCYEQFWKCGKWQPFISEEYPKDELFPGLLPDGKLLYRSKCIECDSVRLIDPDSNSQRIILSPYAQRNRCNHRWRPSITLKSYDPITQGDVLLISFENKLYVTVLTEITGSNLIDQKISYNKASMSSRNMSNILDLSALEWQKQLKSTDGISIADRKIKFVVKVDQDKKAESYLSIEYDQYYGQTTGPFAKPLTDSAHIAIIHKEELSEKQIIDLTKFRFKTWEDGLGNRCGEELGSKILESNLPYILGDSHDGPVWEVVASPDGNYIVSRGNDQRIIIKYLDFQLSKIIGPLGREQFIGALAVNQDGSEILADLGPDEPLETILQINTSDGRYERLKGVTFGGMMAKLYYWSSPNVIGYITTNNKLTFFDLKKNMVISTHEIYGEFLGSIACSPNHQFIAVVSQNSDANGISHEPCKLTIFDKDGLDVLSYQFDSCSYTFSGKLTFPLPNQLSLCLPNGEMWKWIWEPAELKWKLGNKVKIPTGPVSAIESSSEMQVIWIGRNNSVIAFDAISGKELSETKFDVGKISIPFTNPITAITMIPKRNMLAIGLGDGRIALLPIPKVEKNEQAK